MLHSLSKTWTTWKYKKNSWNQVYRIFVKIESAIISQKIWMAIYRIIREINFALFHLKLISRKIWSLHQSLIQLGMRVKGIDFNSRNFSGVHEYIKFLCKYCSVPHKFTFTVFEVINVTIWFHVKCLYFCQFMFLGLFWSFVSI